MRAFLLRLLLFALAPVAAVVAAVFSADGTTDAFYVRFATPKASSMILGSSRAAQGIRPDVLDSCLAAGGWQVKSFNYAFTMSLSNYGPAYLISVMRKLDRSRNDGVFVLAVDPWVLNMRPGDGDGSGWVENNNALGRMSTVSMRPNIEYMFTEYDKPILTPLIPYGKKANDLFLHDNGWLEVRVDMDSAKVARRTVRRFNEYKAIAQGARLSPLRVTCMHAMIDSLAPFGTVLLARLPVPSEMKAIEDGIMPHFDAVMERTAKAKGIAYLNFTIIPTNWMYTDGCHIAADEASRLAALIGEALLNARRDVPAE